MLCCTPSTCFGKDKIKVVSGDRKNTWLRVLSITRIMYLWFDPLQCHKGQSPRTEFFSANILRGGGVVPIRLGVICSVRPYYITFRWHSAAVYYYFLPTDPISDWELWIKSSKHVSANSCLSLDVALGWTSARGVPHLKTKTAGTGSRYQWLDFKMDGWAFQILKVLSFFVDDDTMQFESTNGFHVENLANLLHFLPSPSICCLRQL